MIQARRSEDILTKDVLLSKVSEYQIFKYFCTHFNDVDRKFKSDLREDKTPTVSITAFRGRLWYKDFGYPDHSFDCFAYVGYKYNLNFYDSLKHIDMVFGLGLSSISSNKVAVRKVAPEIREKTKSQIKVRVRPWEYRDEQYWGQFHITRRILRIFDVQPISHYWINELRFSCNSISYRYRFDCGYKIYRPLEADFKWSSNVGSECIQGYRQLPKHGETLFLTSSLKDIMCLGVLGYPSIALQSEMQLPEEKTIQSLNERFKQIIVLYDNDYTSEFNPGQTMSMKICSKYNLRNLCIPSKYESKDVSDLIKNHGKHDSFKIINQYL